MSVVRTLLERHGFEWATDPYRVVDKVSGKTVLDGPSFNFSEKALISLRKSVDQTQNRRFKQAPNLMPAIL